VVRHEGEFDPPPPTTDDLLALAEAVREAARPERYDEIPTGHQTGRRGHLRVIPPSN
jgi:hypothetical protein